MYQYLNMHIRAIIFHTTPKINSFIAFLLQQIDIAATYTHAQQHAQEQPQGTPHLPSSFTSGYTDMAFGHQATIRLKVSKLHYSSLLHPCCGTWLSSRSHCRASVSLQGAGSGCGPAHRSGSCHGGGGMAVPPGMVTQAERLPLYHIYYTYCHIPAAPGSIRQPTVANSTAEEHDAIWYLCNFYTIDTKSALALLTIEGAPGSTHLQSTGCLKASLATQIKSTIRLETH